MSDAYSIIVQTAAAYSLNVVSGPVVQSSFDGNYSSLLGIPATFAPSAHTHEIADVLGLQTALDSRLNFSATQTLSLAEVRQARSNLLSGSSPSFTYDQSGVLTSISYSDGSTKTMVYSNGRLERIDHSFATRIYRKSFSYDVTERLQSVTEEFISL